MESACLSYKDHNGPPLPGQEDFLILKMNKMTTSFFKDTEQTSSALVNYDLYLITAMHGRLYMDYSVRVRLLYNQPSKT